jgi:hypothetical protein
MQHSQHAVRNVEADRISRSSGSARVVGNQDCQFAFRSRRLLKPDKIGCAGGDLFDAVGLRPVDDGAEAERFVGLALRLEGNRAGQNAAVELGQNHVHGNVGGCEAAQIFLPRVSPGGCRDDLKYWYAGAVEQCLRAGLRAGRKSGSGDDGCWFQVGNRLFDKGQRGRVLQRRDKDRPRVDAFGL